MRERIYSFFLRFCHPFGRRVLTFFVPSLSFRDDDAAMILMERLIIKTLVQLRRANAPRPGIRERFLLQEGRG